MGHASVYCMVLTAVLLSGGLLRAQDLPRWMPLPVIITNSDSVEKQFNYWEMIGGMCGAAISTHVYRPQSERGAGTRSICLWDANGMGCGKV